jgi:hypothetical protein
MLALSALAGLLPLAFLLLSWRHHITSQRGRGWRNVVTTVGLFTISALLIFECAYTISWLRNGGSPHGMNPSTGLWSSILPWLKWFWWPSLVLPVFAEGKTRLFLYGSVVSLALVTSLVYALQMD